MSDKPCVIFGDVHGEVEKLQQLLHLTRLRYGNDVDIISVGDLIDRGLHSKEVIDLCIAEGVVPAIGNHDFWMINMLNTGYLQDVWHPIWGAWATVRSYGCMTNDPAQVCDSLMERIPQSHKDYFTKTYQLVLRVDVEGERYWVTHSGITKKDAEIIKSIAGVKSDEDVIAQLCSHNPNSIYFSYPNLKAGTLYEFEKGTQVFGHQIVSQPMMRERWIAIDTGCGTDEPYTLSAVVLPGREIIQVK